MEYSELVFFQWPEEGTFTHREAFEAMVVNKKLMENNKFKRDVYLDLTILMYVFLTGERECNGKKFKLSKPQGVSHARFMQRGPLLPHPLAARGPGGLHELLL